MKTVPADRRTRRTDTLLREALVALILEMPYDAITIQHILDRANVGRSTFYAHYYDKDDLLESNIEWLIDLLSQPTHTHMFPSAELFRHVQSQYKLYQALASSRAADLLYRRAQGYLSQRIQAHLETAERGTPEIPPSFLANYLAGSFVVMLRWWLENKMPYSPEEMERMFRTVVMPGMERALHP